jgi:hypothetical protein
MRIRALTSVTADLPWQRSGVVQTRIIPRLPIPLVFTFAHSGRSFNDVRIEPVAGETMERSKQAFSSDMFTSEHF